VAQFAEQLTTKVTKENLKSVKLSPTEGSLAKPRTQFGFWWFPRSVPDVEDLDFAFGFPHPVVDKEGTVQQLRTKGRFRT
jgi:hypothetical protein